MLGIRMLACLFPAVIFVESRNVKRQVPFQKQFALIREIRVNVRSGSPCFKICVRFEFARLR